MVCGRCDPAIRCARRRMNSSSIESAASPLLSVPDIFEVAVPVARSAERTRESVPFATALWISLGLWTIALAGS